MLANRLRRVHRHLRKWARRTNVTCYRLYDRDIPEHPLVVDWYEGRALVYAMHRKKDETEADQEAWLREVDTEVREGLEIDEEQLFFKERRRQKGLDQYQKEADEHQEFIVGEQGHRFWVNLSDYHDTGLFLDHRTTRRMVQEEAAGKRFLNLFAYTGSFTVYAAAGGATESLTVDISNTYLAWAARNFELNGVDPAPHRRERADALTWLPQAVASGRQWDLIVCDPPTFSNSKKMRDTLDVGERHPDLINNCLRLLSPGGVLYFSTNFRTFKLQEEALLPCGLEEITRKTIPPDYENSRGTLIHRCWRLTHPV